jgi:transposase-like protein
MWTQDRRQAVLDAIAEGCSQREAARRAGIDEATLRHWLRRGESAPEGGYYHAFFVAFQLAVELAEQREAADQWRRLALFTGAMHRPSRPAQGSK